jgi:MFS family permease
MFFAFICHIASAVITMTANGYARFILGTFIFALAGGVVEGVINPITATLYPKNKTHYLNILHAGWPGGMVLGGLVVITLGHDRRRNSWRWKVGLYLVPALIYGWMMLREELSGAGTRRRGRQLRRYAEGMRLGRLFLICLFPRLRAR